VINTPSGTSVMKPGMYCLKDGMIINGNSSISGDGIFIVLLGGDIDIKGTAYVNWKRPNNLRDGLEPGKEGQTGNQWGGMLIYAPRRGDGKDASEIYLSGTSGTKFQGTIFNPGGVCHMGGNGDALSVKGQVVCNYVNLHGTPNLDLTYIEAQNFRAAPMVELVQ
jgi:hypothetical protein